MDEFQNNNQYNSDDSLNDITNDSSFNYQDAPTYSEAYSDNSFENHKKRKGNYSFGVVVLSSIIAAVIGAVGGIATLTGYYFSNIQNGSGTTQTTETKFESSTGNASNVNISIDTPVESVVEAVALKAQNSVVGIRTTASVDNFFGRSEELSGEGSGVVYTADGYIITNYHVIESAASVNGAKIEVFIGDSSSDSYEASVVGYNVSCDLAVLKIDATDLTPVELGTTDELRVGQYAITIGAPGGLEFMGSVTYGVISGLDRVVSTDSDLKLIQTDAAINPGNSGGALLNTKGQLIGINSSKIVSEEFEGMGFAIPVDTVKEKCDKIISRKGESQAYLGVSISSTYTSQVLSFYGYPSGAVVSSVAEKSPAAKAGIERGDIITEFNGVTISEYTVLNDALYDCEPNDTVSVKIYRNGRYYTVDIKLASETSN